MAVDGEYDKRGDREGLAELESVFDTRGDADALTESEAEELWRGDGVAIGDSVVTVLQLATRLFSDDGLPAFDTVCPVDETVADTVATIVDETALLTAGDIVTVCVNNLDAPAEADACAVRELKNDSVGENDANAVAEFDCEYIAEMVSPLAVGSRDVTPLLEASLEAFGDSDERKLSDRCAVCVELMD